MRNLASAAIGLIVSYVVLNFFGIVVLGLRFVAMNRTGRASKSHDWLCAVSLVFLIAYSIDTIIGTVFGDIGIHITEVPFNRLAIALKTFFVSQFFWAISISTFRLSILFLYTQLFKAADYFRYSAYMMITIVCLFFVGSITTTLRMCKPVQFSWDKKIVGGTCGDIGTAELAAAAFNLVLDVLIVLLPLPVVWRLRLPREKKISITITFAFGLIISGINLVRILKVLDCNIADFTFCTRDSAILTVGEMAVGIIAACVPLLGPVIFPRRYADSHPKKYNMLGNESTGRKITGSGEAYTYSHQPGNIHLGADEIELTASCALEPGRSAPAYSEVIANKGTKGPSSVSNVIDVNTKIEIVRGLSDD
ncbi:hypothetical protein AOQ84DRAFT_380783 [Glonium stellatum]|uniref:Rhodopsin domain-containing protein n=1 Tax=Glonium stellatum TaxID=574774 RepID=A0A8E2ET82_9PEZI|nr:hypothetical protein AOQ84DRAFT_380783 [Glonium stellatum]